MSGNNDLASVDIIKEVLAKDYQVDVINITNKDPLPEIFSYSRIIVCGGDGTLNSILNKKIRPSAELIYFPSGTLNETASAERKSLVMRDIGVANDKKFAYVCACGTFTPLGYATKDSNKKRFKGFAYLANVLKYYKIDHISAKITVDGKAEEDVYTLMLVLDSPQCFRFHFNGMFEHDDGKMHILLIKAPKKKWIFSKIRLFFTFFRAFVIGFKKEYKSKRMSFREFTDLKLELSAPADFCIDGEHIVFDGEVKIKPKKFSVPIRIVTPQMLGENLMSQNVYLK